MIDDDEEEEVTATVIVFVALYRLVTARLYCKMSSEFAFCLGCFCKSIVL